MVLVFPAVAQRRRAGLAVQRGTAAGTAFRLYLSGAFLVWGPGPGPQPGPPGAK